MTDSGRRPGHPRHAAVLASRTRVQNWPSRKYLPRKDQDREQPDRQGPTPGRHTHRSRLPPNGYTGPLKPGDLITYAIERALTDKDKLTGVEVHEILDNLNTPHLKPAAEVAG